MLFGFILFLHRAPGACKNSIYPVLVKAKEKCYTNYRLKTRTIKEFNEFHNLFYEYSPEKGKYRKIIPELIRSEMCEIVLAHFIMGGGRSPPETLERMVEYVFTQIITL